MGLAAEEATTKAVEAAIGLERCLLQAVGTEPAEASAADSAAAASELLQVPHFDLGAAREWHKQHQRQAGLQGFLSQPDRERKAFLSRLGFCPQKSTDVEDFVRTAPRLEIEVASVASASGSDGDRGELRAGGPARLEVTLQRRNVAKGEAVGAVHAPLFPSASVPEAWWLLLEIPGESAPVVCKRTANPEKCFREVVNFTAPAAGKCSCRLRLLCESYIGLDVARNVSFTVKKAEC